MTSARVERVVTLGVTGHRSLAEADLSTLRRCVGALLDDLAARRPGSPLHVLSALAEGADRLVVDVALARGHDVFAVLPFAADDYERDFGDRAPAFRALLARIPAERVFALPSPRFASDVGERDAHYAQAGDYIAAHCDVLLALWDGVANALPGGTASVVRGKLLGSDAVTGGPDVLPAVPRGGPVAWLTARRADADADGASVGVLRWLQAGDAAP